MSPEGIPERIPGESPAAYLDRLKSFQSEIQQIDRIKEDIEKELSRRARRIDSITERIVIEKEIRRSLRDPPKKGSPGDRFYWIPDKPGALLIFAPLFILISLVWQNITKTDTRFNNGAALSRRGGKYGDP
jgi:hypothetical protein